MTHSESGSWSISRSLTPTNAAGWTALIEVESRPRGPSIPIDKPRSRPRCPAPCPCSDVSLVLIVHDEARTEPLGAKTSQRQEWVGVRGVYLSTNQRFASASARPRVHRRAHAPSWGVVAVAVAVAVASGLMVVGLATHFAALRKQELDHLAKLAAQGCRQARATSAYALCHEMSFMTFRLRSWRCALVAQAHVGHGGAHAHTVVAVSALLNKGGWGSHVCAQCPEAS